MSSLRSIRRDSHCLTYSNLVRRFRHDIQPFQSTSNVREYTRSRCNGTDLSGKLRSGIVVPFHHHQTGNLCHRRKANFGGCMLCDRCIETHWTSMVKRLVWFRVEGNPIKRMYFDLNRHRQNSAIWCLSWLFQMNRVRGSNDKIA